MPTDHNWIQKLFDDRIDNMQGSNRRKIFTPKQIQLYIKMLGIFSEVYWDRFSVVQKNWYSFFGWIKRPDTHEDFVVFDIVDDMPYSINTSSAQYSEDFAHRINQGHAPCRRVEDYFGNAVQCIHLDKNE